MSELETKYRCRHIFADGHRCGSPALRREPFCYYHHTTRAPKSAPALRDTLSTFDLPIPEDRSAIQAAIGLILQRIAHGQLDSKRAGLLLYGLQIASTNLPKPAATPIESVEELTLDPTHGLIAPESELTAPAHEKNLYDIIMDQWNAEKAQELEAIAAKFTPKPPTEIIPTLHATADDRPQAKSAFIPPLSVPSLPLPSPYPVSSSSTDCTIATWCTDRSASRWPAHTAIKQTTTETPTLPNARPHAPVRISSYVCRLNDENVVNPPQSPTITKMRSSCGSAYLVPASVSVPKYPMTKHPRMFTTTVPHGNPVLTGSIERAIA
jgi:hypothetical protein